MSLVSLPAPPISASLIDGALSGGLGRFALELGNTDATKMAAVVAVSHHFKIANPFTPIFLPYPGEGTRYFEMRKVVEIASEVAVDLILLYLMNVGEVGLNRFTLMAAGGIAVSGYLADMIAKDY